MKPVLSRRGTIAEYPALAPLLLRRGLFRFRVTTGSMQPRLRPGDLLEVKPVSSGELRVGDMVLIPREGGFLCHRLVRFFRDPEGVRVVTQGDSVTGEDPPLPVEAVIGRVDRVLGPRFLRRGMWRMRAAIGVFLRRIRIGPTRFPRF